MNARIAPNQRNFSRRDAGAQGVPISAFPASLREASSTLPAQETGRKTPINAQSAGANEDSS